jgi:hypothetical protein
LNRNPRTADCYRSVQAVGTEPCAGRDRFVPPKGHYANLRARFKMSARPRSLTMINRSRHFGATHA